MTTKVGLVRSADDSFRLSLLKEMMKKEKGPWLILSPDPDFYELGIDSKTIHHNDIDKEDLNNYKHLWIEHWPAIAFNSNLLYALYSDISGITIFAQSHEYKFDQYFFKKWKKRGVHFYQIVNTGLYRAILIRSRKVLKHYINAEPKEAVNIINNKDLSYNSSEYLRLNKKKHAYLYHSKGDVFATFCLWLQGRQAPISMLWSRVNEN